MRLKVATPTRIVFQVAIVRRGIEPIVNGHRRTVTIRAKMQTSTNLKAKLLVHCHIETHAVGRMRTLHVFESFCLVLGR